MSSSVHPSILRMRCITDMGILAGIEEHGRADAIFTVGTMQHVLVNTSLTTPPESLIGGEIVEGHRVIAELSVHLHHGRTASEREDLGMRPAQTGERERHILNAFSQSESPIIGMYDQTRGSHIMFVAPGLNVTESGKPLTV